MSTQGTFDADALRAKYQAERDKRLRPEGNDQYRSLAGPLRPFDADPFAPPPHERAPLHDDVDVAIVGGGFCGLLTGARLRAAGLERIRIIEIGADVGGTWYWNRYPGVQCDIESYIYLPLLEELGYLPKEKYSYGPEIWSHSQAIAHHYDLYRDACFQTKVTELRWDEDAARWAISTDRGDRMTARFVAMAIGPLSRPKLPGIAGIDEFRGKAFHTSRWDYDYTGGDTNGELTKLTDKVVGMVGTGATAVQCIPHLGQWAKHLYVFQRTPSSVDVRGNRPTDPAWAASLQPGWQQRRIDNFGVITTGGFQDEDLVNDGWTEILRNLSSLGKGSIEDIEAQLELADFRKMEQIRARVDDVVHDPTTADALKPWYRQFCKRPCFNDDYLPTFNRPNVTLVDTDGHGIERITAGGVVVGGREYALDCLIFGTGFEVGTPYTQRAGCEVIGRNGVTLTDKWASQVATFHGIMSHGFPNCLLLGGIQTGLSPNFTELYNEQSQHAAYLVARALGAGHRTIEPTAEAETAWVERIIGSANARSNFQATCTPGYYNNEGRPGEGPGWFGGNLGGNVHAFFAILRAWREADDLDGIATA